MYSTIVRNIQMSILFHQFNIRNCKTFTGCNLVINLACLASKDISRGQDYAMFCSKPWSVVLEVYNITTQGTADTTVQVRIEAGGMVQSRVGFTPEFTHTASTDVLHGCVTRRLCDQAHSTFKLLVLRCCINCRDETQSDEKFQVLRFILFMKYLSRFQVLSPANVKITLI